MKTKFLGSRPLGFLLVLCFLCAACGGNDDDDDSNGGADNDADDDAGDDDQGDDDDAAPIVDLRADVNRDGTVDLDDPAEDENEDTWDAAHGAIFLANLDDDTRRCPTQAALSDAELAACNDATDEVVNGEDDLLDLAPLRVAAWPGAPDDAVATFAADPAAVVRLFVQDGQSWQAVAFDDTQFVAADLRAGLVLALEGLDIVRDPDVWDGFVDLTLRVRSGGKEVGADSVRLRVAPIMTFHHLLPEESVYALRIPGQQASLDFFADLQPAVDEIGVPLDDMAEQLDINAIDQWTQDFMEFGYMSSPAAGGAQHVIRVAYRAANIEGLLPKYPLRKAGRVVFTKFRGPDFAGIQEYDPNHNLSADSLNSFGNWETIPPHEYAGASYPLGRLMVGAVDGFAPDPAFLGMVEAQGWQPAVHLDTSWLAVGHVDETLSFAKADNERGWILLINDAAMARQMLEDESAAGHGDTLLFAGMKTMYGLSAERTIDEVLADTEVMSESAVSAVEVQGQLQTLRDEIGVADEQLVWIPYLHERVLGKSLAYNPGTINSLYLADDLYAAPETHGPVIDGVDIFKEQFEAALADWGIGVAWIEDWDLYHILWGEVHCGTNSQRAVPDVKWWEVEP